MPREKGLLWCGIMFAIAALVLTVAGLALAQEPVPVVDPSAAGGDLMDAIVQGAVLIAVWLGGMLLVWGLTTFLLPKLNGKAKAITASVLIGVLQFFAKMAYFDGTPKPADYLAAAMLALTAGMAAATAWGLIPSKTAEKLKAPLRRKRIARGIPEQP